MEAVGLDVLGLVACRGLERGNDSLDLFGGDLLPSAVPLYLHLLCVRLFVLGHTEKPGEAAHTLLPWSSKMAALSTWPEPTRLGWLVRIFWSRRHRGKYRYLVSTYAGDNRQRMFLDLRTAICEENCSPCQDIVRSKYLTSRRTSGSGGVVSEGCARQNFWRLLRQARSGAEAEAEDGKLDESHSRSIRTFVKGERCDERRCSSCC